MKKILLSAAAMLFLSIALRAEAKAEQGPDSAAVKIKQRIEAQRYRFVARNAQPMSGRLISLTPDYDLRVSKDTVASYLPYYGRAYRAPIDPDDTGIMFTCTKFDYKIEPAKNSSWEIRIKTKDTPYTRYDLFLQVFSNGSATLSVADVYRQSITFHGYVE